MDMTPGQSFAVAPELADVFTQEGSIDARLLAHVLGKSKVTSIARALGVEEDTLRHNPTSELAQPRAHSLVDALNELYRYIPDWKSCLIWLNRPYPGMGGKSPMNYIDTGNIEVFRQSCSRVRDRRARVKLPLSSGDRLRLQADIQTLATTSFRGFVYRNLDETWRNDGLSGLGAKNHRWRLRSVPPLAVISQC